MAKKKPTAIVRLEGSRIVPASGWDVELLSDERQGQEFDLVRRSKRSNSHSSMYWAQLGAIVKATGEWPSAEKMHEWVKIKLGYISPVMGPKGQIIGMTLDSTSFDKMDQKTFNAFYEKAAQLIALEIGIDLSDVVIGWSI